MARHGQLRGGSVETRGSGRGEEEGDEGRNEDQSCAHQGRIGVANGAHQWERREKLGRFVGGNTDRER